jgi:adenylate cyclase
MGDGLSIDELAERTGEHAIRLADWRDRGLIGDPDGGLCTEDTERAWLVRTLLSRGVSLDDVARVVRDHPEVLARFLPRCLPWGARTYTFDEAATHVGLEPDRARRLWRAGAGQAEAAALVTDDDLAALRNLRAALDAGFPEDALMQLLRVYGEALGRVAEAETRLFHVYVHKRLEQEGLTGTELASQSEAAGALLEQLVEPTVLYFHRKAWDRSARDDVVTHLADAAGLWTTIDATGQVPAAIAFVDLCGFSALTSAMGDLAAAQVVDRFAAIVRDTVGPSLGQVVKQIGDGFMLLFPDSSSALSCALDLERRVSDEPQFPSARLGIHWGPVLYRDGDYVGATVNLAARVTAEAQAHEVLVTGAVHDRAGGIDDVELVAVGARRVKGFPDAVELFEARPCAAGREAKRTDPVCRMELTPAAVGARVTIGSVEHVFCSTDCLQLFVAAPDQYAP